MTNLIQLNGMNGADKVCLDLCRSLIESAQDHQLIGAEFGVAYGGGVQSIGRLWKPHGGVIYGFDTFTGHPKQLAYSPGAMEAFCMDSHYVNFGTEGLSLEYQQAALDAEDLHNVRLVPGLLHDASLNSIPYLDYCLLDLDLIASMVLAWRLIRTKMRIGAYLCLHDVLPRDHITGLWGLYKEIAADPGYEIVGEYPQNMLAVLRRVPCE